MVEPSPKPFLGEKRSATRAVIFVCFICRRHSSGVPSLSLADDFLVGDELPEILESHLQLAVLNRCFERVHPPQRGPADASSVRGKNRAMARANKLILLLVPRHRATEVRTNRSEHTKPALTVFRYIDRS